jgi:hypothetical protein
MRLRQLISVVALGVFANTVPPEKIQRQLVIGQVPGLGQRGRRPAGENGQIIIFSEFR